jgi:glycosyltransferase involved in cell wall biosynthesis
VPVFKSARVYRVTDDMRLSLRPWSYSPGYLSNRRFGKDVSDNLSRTVFVNYIFPWKSSDKTARNPDIIQQIAHMASTQKTVVDVVTPMNEDLFEELKSNPRSFEKLPSFLSVKMFGKIQDFDIYKKKEGDLTVYVMDHPVLFRDKQYNGKPTASWNGLPINYNSYTGLDDSLKRPVLFSKAAAKFSDHLYKGYASKYPKCPKILFVHSTYVAPVITETTSKFSKIYFVHNSIQHGFPLKISKATKQYGEKILKSVEDCKSYSKDKNFIDSKTLGLKPLLGKLKDHYMGDHIAVHYADVVVANHSFVKDLIPLGNQYPTLYGGRGFEIPYVKKLKTGNLVNIHHPIAQNRIPFGNDALSGDFVAFDSLKHHPIKHLDQINSQAVREFKKTNKLALQKMLGLSQDPNAPIYCWTGRQVQIKGFHLLLDGITEFLEAHPKAQIIICGDLGWPVTKAMLAYQSWLDRLESLNTSTYQRVKIFESLPASKLVQIHAGADFIIHPSIMEAVGIAPMEAMISGCTPIVYPSGGIRDVIMKNRPMNVASGITIVDEMSAEERIKHGEVFTHLIYQKALPSELNDWWLKQKGLFTSSLQKAYDLFIDDSDHSATLTRMRLTGVKHVTNHHLQENITELYKPVYSKAVNAYYRKQRFSS